MAYRLNKRGLNPYFIGLPILIGDNYEYSNQKWGCLNPYFIGLPILMLNEDVHSIEYGNGLNPYFIGLPILIGVYCPEAQELGEVSILILLDYLFL